MRILVTGAGGPAGFAVIRSLVRQGHEVTAVDCDKRASGLFLVDKEHRYIVPEAGYPFIGELESAAMKSKAELIIPTVQEELMYLCDYRPVFDDIGVRVAVSGKIPLILSCYKKRTYEFLRSEKYCPNIYKEFDEKYPCWIKPTKSRGGRGGQLIRNEGELAYWTWRNNLEFGKDDNIVMEYLQGQEYSIYGI